MPLASDNHASAVQRLHDWLARPFRAAIPAALRKWREDQETWDALRLLDDRQLNDFGIYRRPPELVEQTFPFNGADCLH
jgi:uncharacterized protein YjiS (DUF1127 family)